MKMKINVKVVLLSLIVGYIFSSVLLAPMFIWKMKSEQSELIAYTKNLERTIDYQEEKIFDIQTDLEIFHEKLQIKDVAIVTVTAYSPSEDETDSTPYTTAFLRSVRPGIIAISRDLMKKNGWHPGMKVYIENIGIKTVADFMNKRLTASIDIFCPDKKSARRIGRNQEQVAAALIRDYENL